MYSQDPAIATTKTIANCSCNSGVMSDASKNNRPFCIPVNFEDSTAKNICTSIMSSELMPANDKAVDIGLIFVNTTDKFKNEKEQRIIELISISQQTCCNIASNDRLDTFFRKLLRIRIQNLDLIPTRFAFFASSYILWTF